MDPPPLAAALVNASAVFLAGETGVVASLSVSGGVGAYTYAVGGDFTVGADGLLSLAAGDDAATLTATVTIDDSHDNTVPVNAFLTLTIAEGGFICSARCRFFINNLRRQRAVHATPGKFTGRFGDAKLCLGIHGSE